MNRNTHFSTRMCRENIEWWAHQLISSQWPLKVKKFKYLICQLSQWNLNLDLLAVLHFYFGMTRVPFLQRYWWAKLLSNDARDQISIPMLLQGINWSLILNISASWLEHIYNNLKSKPLSIDLNSKEISHSLLVTSQWHQKLQNYLDYKVPSNI